MKRSLGISRATLSRLGEVAQSVEHTAENRGVAGSIPALAILHPSPIVMFNPSLQRAISAILASVAPLDVATRIVAIDGQGGSGKSSLARLLARELGAPIVQTDDFASWENPVDWWPDLLDKALVPLAAGRTARYTPTDWGGPAKTEVVVRPVDIVLLEGVTASREAFRPYLAFSVWIETPRELRLRRGLERDGSDARAAWERWMAEEDAYVERERPAEHADVILPGDADLWM
jgi:uridine kinase